MFFPPYNLSAVPPPSSTSLFHCAAKKCHGLKGIHGGNKQQGEQMNSGNEYNGEEEGPAVFFVHIFISSTNFIFIVYRRFYLCCNNKTVQHTQA